MKALLAFAVLCALASPATGEIPSVLHDPRFDKPAWVAADAAMAGGQLRPELFAPHVLDELRELARENAEALAAAPTDPRVKPCKLYKGQSPAEHFLPIDTLADLTRHAEAIVTGRVVGVRQGFFHGLPGSLLELDARWLKGASTGQTLLFYPMAHVETADGPLCSKATSRSMPPEVGDRFVLFSYGPPPLLFESGTLLAPAVWTNVVHEPRNGQAHVPRSLLPVVRTGQSAVDAIEDAVGELILASPHS